MTPPPSRRALLLGVAACAATGLAQAASPAAPAPPPRPLPPPRTVRPGAAPRTPWGVGPNGEVLVVFAQESLFEPGVLRSTIRALVQRGPASLAGLVAAYGLRILPAGQRTQRRPFARALAVIAHPPKVVALDGQFLLPTLEEALRGDLKLKVPEAQELDDGLFARVVAGESVDPDALLANARRLAIEAVNAPNGVVVLRRIGYAQLTAWVAAPPEGFSG